MLSLDNVLQNFHLLELNFFHRVSGLDDLLLLLVDDEAALRRALARTLSNRGYRVLEAAAGREALELMRAHGHNVRVLITDVRMPGMSGFELVDQLLGEGFDPPVLFISGYTNQELANEGGSLDADATFLAKPVSSKQLLGAVSTLLH